MHPHPKSVGVVIPTFRAAGVIREALAPFLNSPLKPRILVVDSSSDDGTANLARELGASVVVIPQSEFNHGATREMARKRLGTDVVVMATQDIAGGDEHMLGKLVAPILAGEVEISYARQLPRAGASFLEAFPRAFNYPPQGNVRSLAHAPLWGVYTFFCSNSCAAWSSSALDRIGGFRTVLTNEDYFAVAEILKSGGRIAYVAEATVVHSHHYSLGEEFRRYFDTGYVRSKQSWVNAIVGPAEKRGLSFAKGLLSAILRERPWLLPYSLVQTGCKWMGFRVGFWSLSAPLWWKRALSAQPYYWNSAHAVENRVKARP